MTRADPVAEYTAVLDAALRGPRRAKDRLLAEVREGLVDAAEPHRAAGLDPTTAVDRAIAEFGAPQELVPDCQRELTIRQTRRTAAVVAVCVPVLLAGWHLLWTGGQGGWRAAAIALATLTALGALQAVVALVVTGPWGRAVRAPARLPAVTAWTATTASLAMLLATAALAVAVAAPAAALLVAAVAAVAAHAVVARSARACRRCWALDRAVRRPVR